MLIVLNSTAVCVCARRIVIVNATMASTSVQAEIIDEAGACPVPLNWTCPKFPMAHVLSANRSHFAGTMHSQKVVGNLRRAVLLDDGFRLGIVHALQHRPLAEPLAAHDDRDRAGRAALLGMDGVRRHQIDLALRAGRHRGEPHLGMPGPAAVVDAVVALQAFDAVEHAVEHPGVGVVMHAAGPPRHAHHGVDDEIVVRIDIEQEVLAALGRGPVRRMGLERRVLHELLQQRLGFFHAALHRRLRPPRRPASRR